jgi:hypothetical protein
MLTPQQIAEMDSLTGLQSSSVPDVHPNAQSRIAELENIGKSNSEKAINTAKAAVGGFSAGVGGIALTGIDYLGRKAVNKFGTDQMKKNLVEAPSLQDQFKSEMGGDANPNVYGVGQLAGEVSALASPVATVGKFVQGGVKALGAGNKTAKIAQAATEGAAFTAGQSLTEGKQQSLEDYAINSGLNVLFPVAGMVAKTVSDKLPGRIINSLIKPLTKDFAYGKNPGDTVARLGITGNTMEDFISNIAKAEDEAGATIGQVIKGSQSTLKLDIDQTLKSIDEAIEIANRTPRTNATLLSRLDGVKADLLDNLRTMGDTLEASQGLKKLVGDLTKWTGAASDDAAVNKALQKTYTSIRDQVDTALKVELTPEQFKAYKQAADDYGNLMSARNAATHRDNILQRQDLISFGAKNSALLSALGVALGAGTGGLGTVAAGLAGAGIDKAMATPAFKTRLASLLAKLAPKDVATFFEKVPTAKSLYNEKEIKGLFDEIKANQKTMGGFVSPGEIQKSFSKASVPGTDLLQEAKRYKSAEDFVKAKSDPLYEFKNYKTIEDKDIARGTVKEAINDIGGIKNVSRGTVNINDLITTEKVNMFSARAKQVVNEVKSGVKTPIVIDEYGAVMDGHHRLNVYKELGIREIPVIAPKGTEFVRPISKYQLTDIWNKANKTKAGDSGKYVEEIYKK